MIPVVVWYVAVNAAAFGLCAAARSRRTGGRAFGACAADGRGRGRARHAPFPRALEAWPARNRPAGPGLAADVAVAARRRAGGPRGPRGRRRGRLAGRAPPRAGAGAVPGVRQRRRVSRLCRRQGQGGDGSFSHPGDGAAEPGAGGRRAGRPGGHAPGAATRSARRASRGACRCCWRCSARCLHAGARWGEAAGRR